MPEGQCYRICPTQDPYQGDQAAENADYEFNARYDDQRERYAATVEDARLSTMHPDEFDESDSADAREDMERERNEQGFKLARPIPADVNPDDIPF